MIWFGIAIVTLVLSTRTSATPATAAAIPQPDTPVTAMDSPAAVAVTDNRATWQTT